MGGDDRVLLENNREQNFLIFLRPTPTCCLATKDVPS